jgi:hypothetical protein
MKLLHVELGKLKDSSTHLDGLVLLLHTFAHKDDGEMIAKHHTGLIMWQGSVLEELLRVGRDHRVHVRGGVFHSLPVAAVVPWLTRGVFFVEN